MAHKNHYPAIDVLNSVSRLMPSIAPEEHKNAASEARDLLATYKESEDLINIGAYAKGSNKKIDKAINFNDSLNNFLKQKIDENAPYEKTIETLTSMFR